MGFELRIWASITYTWSIHLFKNHIHLHRNDTTFYPKILFAHVIFIFKWFSECHPSIFWNSFSFKLFSMVVGLFAKIEKANFIENEKEKQCLLNIRDNSFEYQVICENKSLSKCIKPWFCFLNIESNDKPSVDDVKNHLQKEIDGSEYFEFVQSMQSTVGLYFDGIFHIDKWNVKRNR